MFNDNSNNRIVVFYGAFDRYNYGDNLMPILFEMYLRKFHHGKLDNINFMYSSIKDSDLSEYDCKPTVAMQSLIDTDALPENSTIVVVGGEVLRADVSTLFLHVQHSHSVVKLLKIVKRIFPSFLVKIAKIKYGTYWDYPYIPDSSSFRKKINIVYNTVGGEPHSSQIDKIGKSEYVSVRDKRTYQALSAFNNIHLVPDSVLMVSSIIDHEFLEKKVRSDIVNYVKNRKYIVLQACPYKVNFSAKEVADELNLVSEQYNIDIVLLPIGYASGHDDIVFLEKVLSYYKEKFILFDGLSVWEIMYIIASSAGFYGTSLHGVITAMSFHVPHYCINSDIKKLVSFLDTWSVSPYNKPIKINEIHETINKSSDKSIVELQTAVNKAQKIIFNSIDDISDIL